MDCPDDMVKLLGETIKTVGTTMFSAIIVPIEYPMLGPYWLSPAKVAMMSIIGSEVVQVTETWP